jgi:radical SAM superfamily enzyme YgiQ (UPF0313 family)
MNIILFTDVNILGYGKYAGPYRLASELRSAGYSVQVVDLFTKYSTEQFKQILNKFVSDRTLWLGFTTTFNAQGGRLARQKITNAVEGVLGRTDILELFEHARSINPKLKIVVGGAKADALSLYRAVDHLIIGQGETSSIELSKALQANLPFPRRVTDIDFPFNGFNNSMIEYQTQDIINDGEHLPIEIARGCIFKCSFCNYPLNGKKMWDYVKQPSVLVHEMQRNYDLFKTQGYLISDDTLNDSVEKVEALHQALTKMPFPVTLGSYARLDLIISHPHTLDLMYEMGSRSFFFGIESLNKKSGQAIGKGMDPDKIKKGLDYIKTRYPDILITGSFIFGLPHETKESLKNTIEYLKVSPIDHFAISPLVIHPGSSIGHDPAKYGYVVEGSKKWKNEFMTSEDAEYFTNEANRFLKPKNKLSYWFMHRVLNCGYTLDDCQTKIMSPENKRNINNKAQVLHAQYFNKLMNL